MERYVAGKVQPAEVSEKLDGVHARATAAGVFSKSGKPLDMPHVAKRLRRHFRKNPEGALEGELWRRKAGVEEIAGAARKGGDAAKGLRLHVYPGQGKRPWPIGAVRRVKGRSVKDDAGVQKAFRKALRKGREGVVVKDAAGGKSKLKPVEDAEYRVEKAERLKAETLKGKTVLVMRTAEGRPFKVQAGGGAAGAKAGDQVQVRYSGLTRGGKPKAAVAVRVRNDRDFSMETNDFRELTDAEREQIRKDRKALVKGAVLTAAGGAAAYALLRKKKAKPSNWKIARPGLPAPGATRREVAGMRIARGKVIGSGRTIPMGPKVSPKAAAVTTKSRAAAAAANAERKGGLKRTVKAAELKQERAWGALRPPSSKRIAKLHPNVRGEYLRLDGAARSAGVKPSPLAAGQLAPSEIKAGLKGDRMARQKARQDLLAYRERKNFQTPFTMRYFKEDGKPGAMSHEDLEKRYGRHVVDPLAPKKKPKPGEVEEEPLARKRGFLFETPASRIINFGNAEQWREKDSRRYGNPLKAAAGLEKGYFRTDEGKAPIVEGIPLHHAQVLKSTYNKAHKIQRKVGRGGALLKDVGAVATGKPRARDAAGRQKKREWEKPWFKAGVRNVAITGALLAGAKHVSKNPEKWRGRVNKGVRQVNRKVPDLMREWGEKHEARSMKSEMEERNFATPASRVLGKFKGPSAAKKAALESRKALLDRVQRQTYPYKGDVRAKQIRDLEPAVVAARAKAARVAAKLKRDVAAKQAGIKLDVRRRKDAVRGVKRGAAAVGAGALVGGSAMKAYADQPEKAKVQQGARFRNSLIGAAAGGMLGGTLAGGKSGYAGARVGALAGGLIGAVSNPKRKSIIEELPLASFETPASRLIDFRRGWEDENDYRVTKGGQIRAKAVKAPGVKAHLSRNKAKYVGAGAGAAAGAALTKHGGAAVLTGTAGLAAGALRDRKKRREATERNTTRRVSGLFGRGQTPETRSQKDFRTPASELFHFDEAAEYAGWDVRDPRGRSARVFAPGSRRRQRREKKWHEKKDNRDKLALAAIAAAGAAGIALGRKTVKAKAAPMVKPSVVPMAPRSTPRRETFRHHPFNKPR